jgi:hypothetical protein
MACLVVPLFYHAHLDCHECPQIDRCNPHHHHQHHLYNHYYLHQLLPFGYLLGYQQIENIFR